MLLLTRGRHRCGSGDDCFDTKALLLRISYSCRPDQPPQPQSPTLAFSIVDANRAHSKVHIVSDLSTRVCKPSFCLSSRRQAASSHTGCCRIFAGVSPVAGPLRQEGRRKRHPGGKAELSTLGLVHARPATQVAETLKRPITGMGPSCLGRRRLDAHRLGAAPPPDRVSGPPSVPLSKQRLPAVPAPKQPVMVSVFRPFIPPCTPLPWYLGVRTAAAAAIGTSP